MLVFPKQLFSALYGTDEKKIAAQTERYQKLGDHWKNRYGNPSAETSAKNGKTLRFFSSPGRSEIGGNHTDHNLGKVLAASIQLDCVAAAAPTGDDMVSICDITYNEDYYLSINQTEALAGETGSAALVRGILQGFKNAGYKLGGFSACLTSNVISAAGISSSASFEMIICLILDKLFNAGSIPVHKYAAIGQFAENKYWNKASGLLDQTACAVGGLISIDFKNPAEPLIEKIPFDFAKEQYSLMIINTGKGHADLSKEYSSIPQEMKSVAAEFGQSTLRGLSFEDISGNLFKIRKNCGDRAVMRALHFIEENQRVDEEIASLKTGDFKKFLYLIRESGNSSWKWLQNVYLADRPQEQSIAVCLALTEHFIKNHGDDGACRIHGGGFAGVIQAFIPKCLAKKYTAYMEKALAYKKTADKKSPVYAMSIRPLGAIEIETI